jgi:glycosyltransferase involved in cell wall biosynthesis
LDSVAAQTYPYVECVVVDDGSTDDSREIIARYSAVKPVLQSNTGHAIAAKNGFRASTGQVIVFLDSDDFLFPDACAEIARQWTNDLVALHYRLQIYRDGKFEHRFWPEGPFQAEGKTECLFKLGYLPAAPTSGNAYASSYVELIFREGTGLAFNSIDSTLAFSAPVVGKTAYSERAFGAYRMHGDNVTIWDRRRPISRARMGLFYGYHAQSTARKLAMARRMAVPKWDFLNGAYELKLYLTIRGTAVEALGLPERAPLACATQAARTFLKIPGLSLARRLANVAIVYALAASPYAVRRLVGERFYNLDFAE